MISSKLNMLRCFKPNQLIRLFNQNQFHSSRLCLEHTKTQSHEDKSHEKVLEKAPEPSSSSSPAPAKSDIVAQAFASISDLKPSKAPFTKKKRIDPIETIIVNAKDVETLLSAVDTQVVSRKHALKVLSILTDWSTNDKIKLSDFESDTRFIKMCRVLGRPIKSKEEPESLGDLSVVLGITGDDEAAKLISSIQLPQMVKILSALGAKRKRSTPLLRSLAFNIGKSSERLNLKQGADVFYATALLNFPDEVLLEKVAADMVEGIPSNDKPAVLGSLCYSMGVLRYKNSELLETITHWVDKNLDHCRTQDLVSLMLTLARVNYTPSNAQELFPRVVPNLTPAELTSSSLWLDLVWSYVVLGIGDLNQYVRSVLSSQFVEQFSEGSETDSVGDKLKLININAAAKHLLTNYEGPFLDPKSPVWDIPLNRSRDKQAMVSVLTDSLVNLVPAQTHLKTNVDSRLGFFIDAEFLLDSRKNPIALNKETKDVHKVAILTLDYHDLCRGTHNYPNGIAALSVRLLEATGYHVITVPHTEFHRNDKLVSRVKYLEAKMTVIRVKSKSL
uniref:Protein TBRG4 n=1 Tax=Cacopsylla melanoneura TaxID=428564 RepID=A0A8D9F653_9HEMI